MRIRSAQRPSAIRTRIKTRTRSLSCLYSLSLRDHLPLEQGLRLDFVSISFNDFHDLRDHLPLEQGLRPEKTLFSPEPKDSQRPSAIRTRIKTWDRHCCFHGWSLRDHLPLEQGLRPVGVSVELNIELRDHLPLEQGLRRDTASIQRLHRRLRDHLPLEQGLRP